MSNVSQKRKFSGIPNASGLKYQRRDDDGPAQSHTQGRLDATFGQRSVFPGLDEYTLSGDDGLDHDDELGALSYLISVREEATSIPTLLVAPANNSDHRSIYENGVGDTRGWYSEGAYTAAPLPPSSSEGNERLGRIPQVVFYESLLVRYHALRRRLNQTPSQDTQAKLDLSKHPTHAKKSREGGREWESRLRNDTPNVVQLALMSKWSVLRLLALMTSQDSVLRRGREIDKNTSLWLWGLLARVPERGEMNNEQIAIVRDLGKKAVLVSLGFKDAADWNNGLDAIDAEMHREMLDDDEAAEMSEESAALDAASEDAGERSEEDTTDTQACEEQPLQDTSPSPITAPQDPSSSEVGSDVRVEVPSRTEEDELAAAKARLLRDVSDLVEEKMIPSEAGHASFPTDNTRVTLDMILTIVGEVYGQRDLLEFRENWDESGSSGAC